MKKHPLRLDELDVHSFVAGRGEPKDAFLADTGINTCTATWHLPIPSLDVPCKGLTLPMTIEG